MKSTILSTTAPRLSLVALAAAAITTLAGCPPTFDPAGRWLIEQNNVTLGSEYGTTRGPVNNTISFADYGLPTPSSTVMTLTYNEAAQTVRLTSSVQVTLNSAHFASITLTTGSPSALTPGCEMRSSAGAELQFNEDGSSMNLGVISRVNFRTVPAMAIPCAAYFAATKAYFEAMSAFPASPIQTRLTQWTLHSGLDLTQLQALAALTTRINATGTRLSAAAAGTSDSELEDNFVVDVGMMMSLNETLQEEFAQLTRVLIERGFLRQ